jgi:hypothetical protein
MWLPVYGGEVITAFEEFNQFLPKVNYKTMTSGNTMKFPAVWKIGSEYHEAGTELLGLDVDTKEYSISLDDRPLVAHFEVDDIDSSMAHYDARTELSRETGRELARQMDRKIAALLLNTSRVVVDTANVNGFPASGQTGGTASQTAGAGRISAFVNIQSDVTAVNGDALIQAITAINIKMDQNDIPSTERCCIVNVPLYYSLRTLGMPTSGAPSNTGVWGRNDVRTGGPGIGEGQGYMQPINVLGVPVYCSNHIPSTDITTGPTKYQGNFTKTGGIMFHKSATGILQLQGVQTEKFRDVRRQSDFMVSKILMGGGALRPYAAYEICDA